ncbi:MAG: leucine-rich repeat domain-containing protein [Lachnospiraceae bacterium]|nr:leucine-rich repeat domain-containing protein [Lachnospiraceae bacterium]
MKQRIFPVALALCLLFSSQSVAYAYQETPPLQENILTEESTDDSTEESTDESTEESTDDSTEESTDDSTEESTDDSTEESTDDSTKESTDESTDELIDESVDESDTGDNAVIVPQEAPSPQGDVLTESIDGLVTRDSTNLTPSGVHADMIALRDQDAYKEGTTWTNYTPYPDAAGQYYQWKGGALNGQNIVAAGCVAFAFVLSDAAFGSLPARMYAAGAFTFGDIKVGDILRVNNDTHTVIVLEVSDAGVILAEGNYNGTVHWGRAMSRDEVMNSTSHYITRYPEGYVSPDDPTANDTIAGGPLDGGLTWNLTKAGTLTISGQGAMPDFGSITDQPWSGNSSQIRKVVIANGVTSIGACAFWNCGVLSAEIASSVTTIGSNAFYGSSIISVDIPSSVKTIGDSAFRACQSLRSATVSEGVETIGQNAFRSCAGLTSIALPASIGEVGAGAFFQCQEMTSATFAPGSRQVKLGDNLFTECYNLKNVALPKSINCIGEGMFQDCLMLGRVEIPQGAESIGASAFASCSRMTAVIIPDSVTTIGIAAFSDCSSLTDIYFTGTEAQWNSISKIGDTATTVSTITIHYNYTPAPDDGNNNDNNNDNNTGNNPGGDRPGSDSGNTSGSDRPGSSSGDNVSNNEDIGSDGAEDTSMASSVINSGIKPVVEIWKPTTLDELKRYTCMGKEDIRYTLPEENAYPIVMENAMQGPMCFQSFETVLGDYTIGRTYNIYALSNTTYSTDEEVQLTIEIPSAIYKNDRDYKMICVTKGGKAIIYNDLDSNPRTITIRTNKFYAYALIYK